MICGSLTWLADHEHFQKSQLEEKLKCLSEDVKDDDPANKHSSDAQVEPTWFTLATKNIAISRKQNEIKSELDKIHQQEERIQKLKQRMKNMPTPSMTNLISGNATLDTNSKKYQRSDSTADEDDNILIKDRESDEESVIEESCEEMVF